MTVSREPCDFASFGGGGKDVVKFRIKKASKIQDRAIHSLNVLKLYAFVPFT